MFDIKWIRENAQSFDAGLARRGVPALSRRVLELDARRRACQTELQKTQAQRNAASRWIGAAKAKGEDASEVIAEIAALKEQIRQAEEESRRLDEELADLLAGAPNLLADDVPDGADEADNRELRRVGEPRLFDFEPREHFELGEALGLMDFEAAAAMSGARFVVLKGALARL